MSRRGTPILEAWEQARQAEREQVVVTSACSWCRKWTLTGPVVETRQAYLEHLAAEHPEVKLPRRTRRHRPFRQFNSGTNIDDNIANARREGAATWA
jgi:hypothetical protein